VYHDARFKEGTGKVVPVYATTVYSGRRGTAPLILNFGTRQR